jgi:uncharacterized cupin superfamily protein
MTTGWKLVHAADVEEQGGSYPAPADHVPLARFRDLGRAAGTLRVGASLDRLGPGAYTSLTHAHTTEEEFVYVLAGACTLRIVAPGAGPEDVPARAGDFVAFPPGTGVAHAFRNDGDADCLLFVVGERRDDDRVFYPEHPDYDASFAERRPQHFWAPADRPR